MQQAGVVGGEQYRGWLWVCVNEDTVLVHIDRHRSAAAGELFGHLGSSDEPVVLVCDRYRAYQKLAKETRLLSGGLKFQLAYCWSHVRRDFIQVAEGRGAGMKAWKVRWLARIGQLFKVNTRRVEVYDGSKQLAQQSAVDGLHAEYFRDPETASGPPL